MRKFTTDFYFLGDRSYVHGPTILGTFLELVDQTDNSGGGPGEATILTCRFRQMTRENGVVLSWTGAEERPKLDATRVYATTAIQRGGETYGLALIHGATRPINRRLPYDESTYLAQVLPDGDFGGKGTLTRIQTKKDLIRAIVAFNKVVHDEALRKRVEPASYRWTFASLDGLRLPGIPSQDPEPKSSWDAEVELARISVWGVGGNLHSLSHGVLCYPESEACAFRIGFTGQPK